MNLYDLIYVLGSEYKFRSECEEQNKGFSIVMVISHSRMVEIDFGVCLTSILMPLHFSRIRRRQPSLSSSLAEPELQCSLVTLPFLPPKHKHTAPGTQSEYAIVF